VERVGGAEIASKVEVQRSLNFICGGDWISEDAFKDGRASGEDTHVNSLRGLLSKSLEREHQHTWT